MNQEDIEIFKAGIWGNEDDQVWSVSKLETANYEQYLSLVHELLTIVYDDVRVDKEKMLEDVKDIIKNLGHEEELENFEE